MTETRRERRHLFPAEERLRTDREYRDVVRKGERVGTVHYTVYRDALGGERRQVGVSAGKRAGGSVARNRMKRLLREFYRLHKEVFPRGSPAEGLELLKSHELTAIGSAADQVARRMHPEPFRTYNIDRNINYSNVCTAVCDFCRVLSFSQERRRLRAAPR